MRLRRDRAVALRVITGGMPSPSEVSESVALPANWSIEYHHDPEGVTNIVLMPDPIDDSAGPTLVIYRDGSVVHLDALRWDTYAAVGEYGAVGDALAAAARLIHEAVALENVH